MNEEISKTIPKNGIPADGVYNPPTNIEAFNTLKSGVEVTPYNETLIGDSALNVVGTSTNPYLPAILPVYIPTLYENIYSIQTNLVNDLITVSYDDNRQYPNAKAVKDYVASQLAGFELVTASAVSTILTTSILQIGQDSTFVEKDTANGLLKKYSYEINSIDTSRNGAEKIIICNAALSNTVTMTLSAGTNGKFAVLGKYYSYYQFPIQGDIIDMIQFINTETTQQNFFVKSFGGKFFN